MENKTAQKYLNQVRRFLVCDRVDQKQLLVRCEELIDSFQQENPEADYAGLVSAFGEPAACAAELLSSLDESKIASARKRRKLLQRIALAAISIIVMMSVFTASFWYAKYLRQCELDDKFVVVIEPPIKEASEEFFVTKEPEAQFNGGK